MPKINQLDMDISDWYIRKVTEQDLSWGELNIAVLEGCLEKIHLEGISSRQLTMTYYTEEG